MGKITKQKPNQLMKSDASGRPQAATSLAEEVTQLGRSEGIVGVCTQ